MKIDGIEITHPDKVIFPKSKITKIEMISYYSEVAEKMLPYLKNRVLSLNRFPDGIESKGFYQKKWSDYYPDFIKKIQVTTEEGENTQIVCNSKKALIYLANQGTVGFHSWLSKIDDINKPDKVVFDLDPAENSFEMVKEATEITGAFLRKKNIEPLLMTTGQHGFHVWYNIRRSKTFDEIKPQLKAMAQELERLHPTIFTTAVRINQRDGKVFVDYLRNAYAQTSVCPYSLRPNPSAGIAMPITWDELMKLKSADQFTLKNH